MLDWRGHYMARSKTSSFWLTETILLPSATAADTRVQGTLDLGAYVDVGDQQAISIEYVDFITQSQDTAVDESWVSNPTGFLTGNGTINFQLTDLNPGTELVRADDNSLIASGSLAIDDANNIATHAADFYPDSYGKLDESRFVVNDSLFFVGTNTGFAVGGPAPTGTLAMTVRVKCRIVKLSSVDWMAIAIQSTASDN